jgi:hypothetical protein
LTQRITGFPDCVAQARIYARVMAELESICIRCEEMPAVDELGYCGHCHWAARAEIEEGLYLLRDYLRNWARFDAWCREHGAAA